MTLSKLNLPRTFADELDRLQSPLEKTVRDLATLDSRHSSLGLQDLAALESRLGSFGLKDLYQGSALKNFCQGGAADLIRGMRLGTLD